MENSRNSQIRVWETEQICVAIKIKNDIMEIEDRLKNIKANLEHYSGISNIPDEVNEIKNCLESILESVTDYISLDEAIRNLELTEEPEE